MNILAPGVSEVVLTVTDNDAETAQAPLVLLMDDGDEGEFPDPAVAAEPLTLVAEVGKDIQFVSDTEEPQGENLAFSWDFGAGQVSADSDPVTSYTTAGRWEVSLVVSDDSGNTSTARMPVYTYVDAGPRPDSKRTPINHVFNGNHIVMPFQANDGRTGRSVNSRLRGDLTLGPNANIIAQDGGDGRSRAGTGDVMGGPGKRGGSVNIRVSGNLVIRGGAFIANGDGGDATATATFPVMAWARGGNGGPAGRKLSLISGTGLDFIDPMSVGGNVQLDPGSGGEGGVATATGDKGTENCPAGGKGAAARARGGNGDKAGKYGRITGNVIGLGIVEIVNAMGGGGGDATATGGDGGFCHVCK
jgi:hypothetical protein